MKKNFVCLLVFIFSFSVFFGYKYSYKSPYHKEKVHVDSVVIETPYLNAGNVDVAPDFDGFPASYDESFFNSDVPEDEISFLEKVRNDVRNDESLQRELINEFFSIDDFDIKFEIFHLLIGLDSKPVLDFSLDLLRDNEFYQDGLTLLSAQKSIDLESVHIINTILKEVSPDLVSDIIYSMPSEIESIESYMETKKLLLNMLSSKEDVIYFSSADKLGEISKSIDDLNFAISTLNSDILKERMASVIAISSSELKSDELFYALYDKIIQPGESAEVKHIAYHAIQTFDDYDALKDELDSYIHNASN